MQYSTLYEFDRRWVYISRILHKKLDQFLSGILDPNLPAIKLNVTEGRNALWGKTREAFRYVWETYRDQVDWFYKADDDTYEKNPIN